MSQIHPASTPHGNGMAHAYGEPVKNFIYLFHGPSASEATSSHPTLDDLINGNLPEPLTDAEAAKAAEEEWSESWSPERLLNLALARASKGFEVFPADVDKAPVLCSPINASRDPATIRALFERAGGVACYVAARVPEGCILVDPDRKGGANSDGLAGLNTAWDQLAEHSTADTPSFADTLKLAPVRMTRTGGIHILFLDPGERADLSQRKLMDNVDTRLPRLLDEDGIEVNKGGYVVTDGPGYRDLNDLARPTIALPQPFVDELKTTDPINYEVETNELGLPEGVEWDSPTGQKKADEALKHMVANDKFTQGNRDNSIYEACCHLFDWAISHGAAETHMAKLSEREDVDLIDDDTWQAKLSRVYREGTASHKTPGMALYELRKKLVDLASSGTDIGETAEPISDKAARLGLPAGLPAPLLKQLIAKKENPDDYSMRRLDGTHESGADMRDRHLEYIVYPLIPRNNLVIWYGGAGKGKTYTVLNLALEVARGAETWAGGPIRRPGPVLFYSCEGEEGMSDRIQAHFEGLGLDQESIRDTFRIRMGVPTITRCESDDIFDMEKLTEYALCAMPSLIIIDFYGRALGVGESENDDGPVRAAFNGLRALQASMRAIGHDMGIIILAHTGKANNGPRGHSALFDNGDIVVEQGLEDGVMLLTAKKVKDGAMDARGAICFRPQKQFVGENRDGDKSFSSYLIHSPEDEAAFEQDKEELKKRALASVQGSALVTVLTSHVESGPVSTKLLAQDIAIYLATQDGEDAASLDPTIVDHRAEKLKETFLRKIWEQHPDRRGKRKAQEDKWAAPLAAFIQVPRKQLKSATWALPDGWDDGALGKLNDEINKITGGGATIA